MTDELAEARAQITRLRRALKPFAEQFNSLVEKYDVTDSDCYEAKIALEATSADAYRWIRAEILDEAFTALPEENFKFVDRDKIKAVFEKLKDRP